MTTAPIVLFVYNRPDHTVKTLQALSENDLASESLLIIYADGPKATATTEDKIKIGWVRSAARSIKWPGKMEIIESDANKGLAQSVIDGVTATMNRYGRAIILEDDLVTAKGFLEYMNKSLEKFAGEEKVMQVSGYMFPIDMRAASGASFFLPFITSWGWATWKRAWDHFDPAAAAYTRLKTDKRLSYQFDLKGSYPYSSMLIRQMEGTGIDSWAIRWWWSVFKRNGVVLYPCKSLIQNIGYGKEATHTAADDHILKGSEQYEENNVTSFPDEIIIDEHSFHLVKDFLSQHFGTPKSVSWFMRLYSRIKNN
jgi:hypothetical protein